VGFSGDVGRPNQLIVPDPEVMPQPDALFMETTYGNRLHKSLGVSQEELIAAINQAYQEGGKVLIPVFAVERTQEVIFTLAAAYRRGELPQDMPVFLDSPLAIKATNIFREHPEFFDMQTKEILEQGHTPLNLPTLKPTPGTEESRAINAYKGPAVIMAGNGMASAGRIKHHLKHNLWRPNCHVVIVGFQARGTTGRRLVEGARTVKVFREDVAVRAKVHTIGGFSAHADQKELLGWLERLERPGMLVNLIHGEEQSSLDFMAEAQKRFPEMSFRVPTAYQSMALPMTGEGEAPLAEAAAPRGLARRELADRLGRVRDRLSEMMLQLDSSQDMTPDQRLEFQRRLEAAERLLAGEEAA
jgi:metallo-beta-lactamase family protein